MTEHRLPPKGFKKHMIIKMNKYKPDKIWFGSDFCVMQFDYPYRATKTMQDMKAQNEYYKYTFRCAANRLVVINKQVGFMSPPDKADNPVRD